MKRITLLIIIMVLITASVLASVVVYKPLKTYSESKEHIEVVDVLNRTVIIPKNISRVVAIGPGALRLITYLNALDLIVGVEQVEVSWNPVGRDYAMAYSDRLMNLSIVGGGGPATPPNPEMLRVVNPQLIIMSRTYAELYQPDRLSSEVNASVLVVDYGVAGYLDIESIKNALTVLGRVLGREERAVELCKYIDYIITDLSNRTKDVVERPKVYVGAISYKGAQPFTSTQANFAPLQLINTPSIVDALRPKGGFTQIDFEYLLQQQPDYIFIDENNLKVVMDDFMKDKSKYCGLKAFNDGRVYGILPFNYYHTNVATAIANAYFMGKILYPDRFSDIDVQSKADEIFKAFLGKPLYEEFIKGGYLGFTQLNEVFKCG